MNANANLLLRESTMIISSTHQDLQSRPTRRELRIGTTVGRCIMLAAGSVTWMANPAEAITDGRYNATVVTYSFEDISSTGTVIHSNADDESTFQSLGFSFSIYDRTFSQVAVSTNGLLTFTSTDAAYLNQPLTTIRSSAPLIAPWWDDWVTDRTTEDRVLMRVVGTTGSRRAIFQWEEVNHFIDSISAVTFQAILYEGSNDIRFNYLDAYTGADNASNAGGSGTIGIQGDSSGEFLQWSYNVEATNNTRSILFESVPALGTTGANAGNVRVGTSISQSVVASNLGGPGLSGTIGTATGNVIAIPSGGVSSFSGLVSDAEVSRTFTLTPTTVGSFTAVIPVTSNGGNQNVSITGTGVSPILGSGVGRGGEIELGKILPGTEHFFTLRNDAPTDLGVLTDLTITNVTITGVDAGFFHLSIVPSVIDAQSSAHGLHGRRRCPRRDRSVIQLHAPGDPCSRASRHHVAGEFGNSPAPPAGLTSSLTISSASFTTYS
jgi:hypothetical protein